jgi:3'(2'), 5'-bisphosphate nucleotidase
MQYSSLMPSIIPIALEAGEILMKHYKTALNVEIKGDNSPVTIADQEADNLISAALKKLSPNIPVISEEGDYDNMPHTSTYWLVDPLDGTRSFIKHEDEFTVNIGLVVNNRAFMGVIFAPALKMLYYTWVNGKAYKHPTQNFVNCEISGKPQDITVSRRIDGQGLRVIASKNHRNSATEEYIKSLNVKEFISASSSYKFCLLAEGKADIYPRFGNTMQWDTCAGQAILEAAGGKVTKTDGAEFLYKFNHLDVESLRNSHFIASN